MKILMVGCVEFSHAALERVLSIPEADVVAVVTRDRSPSNADFRSLRGLADANGVPCFSMSSETEEGLAKWLSQFEIDVGYCFGWSRLLGPSILSIPRKGIVGFHPAALPMNRGRHPLIWALALGLRETASTFFFMTEDPDAGPIISQAKVPIDESDDAGTLYAKVTAIALDQITALTLAFSQGHFVAVPQDESRATYWRKRTRLDGRIDWRMSCSSIRNLVRALAQPYPGATFLHNGTEVVVWRVSPAGEADDNLEPGKVLSVDGRTFTIRVGDGALRVEDHDLAAVPEAGSYL